MSKQLFLFDSRVPPWVRRLCHRIDGASAIQCCYAAIERREWSTSTNKAESKNTKVTLRSAKKCMVEEKISRNVSRLVVNPACMAGVRTSSPNFSAL